MTIEEFGQKIKMKYPQYADLSDKEIGGKMLQKYPEYQDMVSAGTPQEVQQKGNKFLERTAGILDAVFGGGKIGEAIGTVIAKSGITGLSEEEREAVSPGPTATQVAGDVANVGLTVAGLKGVGTVGSLGARILKTAGLGAGLAGTKAISEGADIEDVAKSTAIGGIIGGAIPVAGAGLRAIGRQIEQLPARFINSALGRNKAQVLNDIAKDKIDDFSKYVLATKKPLKSANTHLSESSDAVESLSKKVADSLSSAIRKTGDKTTIGVNNFLDELVKLPEAEGALLKRADIKAVVEKLAPQTKQLLSKSSLNLEEANKLRQLVDRTLGDRAFLGGQLSSDKIILKQFANNLREMIKNKAPEGTRELFTELSNEIRFRNGLLERIAKKAGNQVLSFGDFIGGGLGGIFGGGIGGAVLGVAGRRALESVPFKIGSAQFINALTKVAPVLDSLTSAQQTAILNLFAEILSKSPDQENEEK